MEVANKNIDHLKELVKVLPDKPGIYQYFDKNGTIIYVGKAKKLKKRVSSYFNRNHYDNNKLKVLVSKIVDIKHIVVNTETDALLLENNLIKKYQPRYNILLKDDKTYPWICVKNENFPRVFLTRRKENDGSQYFGPYTSIGMIRNLLKLIKALYKPRICNYALTLENIKQHKFKACLEYHIGNCLAPCIGLQSLEDYNSAVQHIKSILKGNLTEVIDYLENEMNILASELKYEQAKLVKDQIEILKNYQSKSTIVNPDITNVDVFSIDREKNFAIVNYLRIIHGAIIQAHTLEIDTQLDEDINDLLLTAIVELRERYNSMSREIIVPFQPDIEVEGAKYLIPKMGDKKKLLELSERNVKYYKLERQKRIDEKIGNNKVLNLLKTIQNDLHLNELPKQIECFDNSNIQGTNPVGSCVVFINGKPAKRLYRHFNIKTVEGPNDFASMEETVYRRYKRLLDEGQPLPQLVVVDGGKGQLSAAMKSLEKLNLRGKIAIIGIAKKLEEIYFPDDSVPIYLDKNSLSLKTIQQLRDEAHRFGITFHRQKRSNSMIHSELDNIQGIGVKNAKKLIEGFSTVAKIKTASINELESVLGKSKAQIVYEYFQKSGEK
ncbi:MAG: excinuclease ABC subunit UvrC [Bacteroidota bacterium]|nr:excinuclease ABC subunit UvrC [Bacteroidota bacterium]